MAEQESNAVFEQEVVTRFSPHVAVPRTLQNTVEQLLPTADPSGTKNKSDTKMKVLVADDEHVIANTLAIILNQAGFDARAVYSGEKAIEAALTFEPQLLITDVVMGGMTGIEAAIQICALLPSCKVLLFSGQAATADLLRASHAQGNSFEILAKPVHPADLLRKLREGESSLSTVA